MAGVSWGAVILAAGFVALKNRYRLEAFGAGIHSDRYAFFASWAFVVSVMAMGVWAIVAGVWSISN